MSAPGDVCKSEREDDFILPAVPSSDAYSSDPQLWDLIIVGAGVAGAALAFAQAKDGRRVLVIDRDLSQPDRIVGELLQPGGYLKLKQLGLADATDDIDSQKVYGYALFKNGGSAVVKYPMEGQAADVAGRSFHHGRFVQKMRIAASKSPNITMRQGFVKKLINADGEEWEEGQPVSGVRYKAVGGEDRVARAHLTIVCDGMYSNLRKKLSEPEIQHPSFFVGIILKGAKLPFPNHGHVVLAKPSPILFYPISSTEVRCLVDVPGKKLPADLPEYLRSVVAPEVPDVLRGHFLKALDESLIRTMQNTQLYSKPLHQPGALLLGDAFNMRHPLTGGGMTVALSDCKLLSDMLQPLPTFADPVATASRTADFYVRRKPMCATINTLANALYKVFCFTGDKAHEEMRQACFEYLSLGGIYSSGPISLLSGLNPKPSVLVAHFFMVALYGVGRVLWPRPTMHGLWISLLLLLGAARIIFPIILAEGPIAVFFPWIAEKPIKATKAMQRVASKGRLA